MRGKVVTDGGQTEARLKPLLRHVDADMLTRLEEVGLIDKKDVCWWQFGFEGRRIVTEQEFNKGLMAVTFNCLEYARLDSSEIVSRERTFSIWTEDFIPVLLKTITLQGGIEAQCFITVKPISHDLSMPSTREEMREFEARERNDVAVFSEVLRPHVRGVVIESTDKFLFWYPIQSIRSVFREGVNRSIGSVGGDTVMQVGKDMVMLEPIGPTGFYDNIIRSSRQGRRRISKGKSKNIDADRQGYRIVPYYEFDPLQNHLMIYPAKIHSGPLDSPIIVKGDPDTGVPEIVGTGLFELGPFMSIATYWELSHSQKNAAKMSLIEAFGRIEAAKRL